MKEDRQPTAFSTSHGYLEFNRIPFGLKRTSAIFQRLMNAVLTGLIGKVCFVKLDHIVSHSMAVEEHLTKINQGVESLKRT